MSQKLIVVDSPEIAGRGGILFPDAKVIYANGSLPPDAIVKDLPSFVVSSDAARIESLCATFAAANVADIKRWQVDLSKCNSRKDIDDLLKLAGNPIPYEPKGADGKRNDGGSSDKGLQAVSPKPDENHSGTSQAVKRPSGSGQDIPAHDGGSGGRVGDNGEQQIASDRHVDDGHKGGKLARNSKGSDLEPSSAPRTDAGHLAAPSAKPAKFVEAGRPEVLIKPFIPRDGVVEPDRPSVFSESWFATVFAETHGENWRCVRQWGKWFNWDGEAWCEDITGCRMEPMRALFDNAQNHPEAKGMQLATRRALFGRKGPMENALALVGTHKTVRATPQIWDADPWMLGVPGGVVDLSKGTLMEAAREQHITMRCSVKPEHGEPKTWLAKLDQWTGGDPDIIGFIRRYLGYALTGDSREQCMAFFFGPAQSGKGTILRTISGILGSLADGAPGRFSSYHYEAPIKTFMEQRGDSHTTDLAAFYKKRLITSEEPNAGAKWDEGKLKWITGGSMITARYIAKDNFSFAMTGKIIVAANHRPRLSTTDKAIRRRIMVIPFEHPVTDENRDNSLDARLRDEWPQILHWLIQGCLEWQDAGLGLPERIATSTDQYLESEDTLGAWMDECCERNRDTDGAVLYRSYADWCDKNGDNAFGRRAWSNALIERGFGMRKGTAGARLVCSLNLKSLAS